jgi:hypothetical protein
MANDQDALVRRVGAALSGIRHPGTGQDLLDLVPRGHEVRPRQ